MVIAGAGICRAGELNINVILSGQVAPGETANCDTAHAGVL